MNRLADSSSPYLRQHASDPVDWYPWGPEAFAAATARSRPIFLSSGYSACHWCHVMQRETFADPVAAASINERYIAVKLDRELRPDVDALYMDYVVATAGHGGWPLSLWLTPDLVPLMGGTYLPAEASGATPTFTDVSDAVHAAWSADGEQLEAVRSAALEFLREQAAPRQRLELSAEDLDNAAEYLLRWADPLNGGFGSAPKFPQAALMEFLIAYLGLNPDPGVMSAIERALTAIVRGGIYDQVGGGLHRYAVDAAWRTPHFEKMLYDNGQLLSNLALAAPVVTNGLLRDEFAAVAGQTARFLVRDMAAPEGGFYAALSADTLGDEGATYLWTPNGLRDVLTESDFDWACDALGVDRGDAAPQTLTRAGGRDADAERLDAVLERLLDARHARPQPEPDTKVLTSWNALAARGLMDAGRAFDDPAMTALGLETLRGVEQRSSRDDGVVHEPDDPAVDDLRLIEDHALLASACLTAHEVTDEPAWLERAVRLHRQTLDLFAEGEVLYMVPSGTELPVRPREQGDTPMPSGAATALDNAVRLAEATGDSTYAEFARAALSQFWALVDFAPEHAGRALTAAVRLMRSGM